MVNSNVFNLVCLFFYTQNTMSQSILKSIFISIILISATTKALDFRNVVILMNTTFNISFYTANILLGFLITVEIAISVLIWKESYQLVLVYHLIIFLFIIFIVVNVLSIMLGINNCGCFGTIISIHPVISLVKCIILLLILGYLRYKKKLINVYVKI